MVLLIFYADDLNDPYTERKVKNNLWATNIAFQPIHHMVWVNCINYTYRLPANECGPGTFLALTVMLVHPFPHNQMLLPYMNPSMAQQSRIWMSSVL